MKYELHAESAIARLKSTPVENGSVILAEKIEGDFTSGDHSFTDLPGIYHVMVEQSFGEGSFIRHEIFLPEDWNGIFLGNGNGGIAGKLDADRVKGAVLGYVMAQTDMGTSKLRAGLVTHASPELWRDYSWRSTHAMTVISKDLIRSLYGKNPDKSYFRGASAGGFQAFCLAQRFPEDYDGIHVGVPSNNALNLITYFLWCHVSLHDKNNVSLFTNEQKEQVYSAVLAFFAAHGQAEETFITHGWLGEDTVDRFISYLREQNLGFSEEQISAIRAMYEGPVHKKTGKRIFCGVPFGSEINCGYFGETDGEFGYPWFKIFFDEGFEDGDFDFSDMYDEIRAAIGDIFVANSADLSAFKARGGKMFIFSGGADPYGPWPDTVNYYNRLCEKMGGYESVRDFCRLFILPGRSHGATGRGINSFWMDENRTDTFLVIRNWCENGVAPSCLYAAHLETETDESGNKIGESISMERKIYPYEGNLVHGIDFPPCTNEEYLG